MTLAMIGWGVWGWALACGIAAASGLAVSEMLFSACHRPPAKKRKKSK